MALVLARRVAGTSPLCSERNVNKAKEGVKLALSLMQKNWNREVKMIMTL